MTDIIVPIVSVIVVGLTALVPIYRDCKQRKEERKIAVKNESLLRLDNLIDCTVSVGFAWRNIHHTPLFSTSSVPQLPENELEAFNKSLFRLVGFFEAHDFETETLTNACNEFIDSCSKAAGIFVQHNATNKAATQATNMFTKAQMNLLGALQTQCRLIRNF
jgi:hypothetical protein